MLTEKQINLSLILYLFFSLLIFNSELFIFVMFGIAISEAAIFFADESVKYVMGYIHAYVALVKYEKENKNV